MKALNDAVALYEETLPGGWNWSHTLKRGTSLELTDPNGGACAALLAYNPVQTLERYNLPDTAKIQFVAQLTAGNVLYSDMGRILLSVLEDTAGGHDLFGGVLSQADLEARYGQKSYQEHRNAYHRSGRLALVTELAKYGLDDRDLVPNVNFFCKTVADDQGRLRLVKRTHAGARVVLQAEMDTLVVLAATQHPFDDQATWSPQPVRLRILDTRVAPEDNPCRAFSASNQRGFANTALYHL